MKNTDLGFIAARAVNAHPWLDATYPDHDDTDLAITPPYPAKYDDRPTGHIEGRITWKPLDNGNVIYSGAIAYEGTWTVEHEFLHTIDPNRALAWLDLARTLAEQVEQLDRIAHEQVDPGPHPFQGWLTQSGR